jgi:HAD superfamily hydrolase (TIGR01509 family)
MFNTEAMSRFPARLAVTPLHKALLWDMDGVLIDSLGLDVELVDGLISKHLGAPVAFSRETVRSFFALDPEAFLRALLKHCGHRLAEEKFGPLHQEYLAARRDAVFPLLPGVLVMLKLAEEKGMKQAVVSNNPTADLHIILQRCGIADFFTAIIGNDLLENGVKLRKKPAPDFYAHACRALGVAPHEAIVFEDSVLGITAGVAAGCRVAGLLTGAADRKDMEHMQAPPACILENLLETF